MDFAPAVLKITLQLPVPLERVIVQFVSAPVMLTVPVGIVAPVTVTEILTDPPASDGLGAWLLIVVIVVLSRSTE